MTQHLWTLRETLTVNYFEIYGYMRQDSETGATELNPGHISFPVSVKFGF
jgi:hypothetical protein